MPPSATAICAIPRAAASARTHTRARPSLRNLSAFATRFCSSCSSCPRSPITTGRSPISISAPASTIAAASERRTSAVTVAELHSLGGSSPRPAREYASSPSISERMRAAPSTA